MTWNYRVIRKWYDGGGEDTGYAYHIHQCHYHRGDEPDAVPHSWTHGPCLPYGDTAEELQVDIQLMAQAFDKPILEEHNGKLWGVRE